MSRSASRSFPQGEIRSMEGLPVVSPHAAGERDPHKLAALRHLQRKAARLGFTLTPAGAVS